VAGEVTAHGTYAHDRPSREDSELVRRLRAAGAIVIGKVHMSELAIFPWTETWAWGTTRNPWNPAHTSGGSSGGSGAAVAAGLAGAATGSDGGGSIRIPAACCGVVGLKPQRGRVSLSPDREHWRGLTVYGGIARTALDAALFLDVTAGAAHGEADAPPAPDRPFVDAARSAPGRLRVAVSKTAWDRTPVHASVREAVDETAGLLRSLGHDVREHDPDYGLLTPYVFPRYATGIDDDLRRLPDPGRISPRARGLARVGRLLEATGATAWARRGEAASAHPPCATPRRLGATFEHHDVLLTPAIPQPPDRVGRTDGHGWLVSVIAAARVVPFMVPWNITGQPAITVPSPRNTPDGLPLAVQLAGRRADEACLLSLAAQLEAEIGWPERRPPAGDTHLRRCAPTARV
jgi:amidase